MCKLTSFDVIACRLGKFSNAQLAALSSVYTHFQAASMDFAQLMNIDYAKAMRCECEVPYQDLTADGTTISCQAANICIINPWCVPLEEKQLTRDSTFAQRILVHSADAPSSCATLLARRGSGARVLALQARTWAR
jgi:hypothetical protein